MSGSSQAVHQHLADALRQSAVDAGANSPAVRGSDWRTATVTAVNGDGTVVADGITVRRMESYPSPVVGDVIAVTQASNGNWLAWGRTAGTGITQAEQTGTLNMSWSAANTASATVTFPVPFAAAPRVFVNINSGDGAVARWSSRAYTITTTNFIALLSAPTAATTTGANIPVQWFAIAP